MTAREQIRKALDNANLLRAAAGLMRREDQYRIAARLVKSAAQWKAVAEGIENGLAQEWETLPLFDTLRKVAMDIPETM
jgi:hypothetical protein